MDKLCFHPPRLATPSSSSSAARDSTLPAAPKLCDSCDACAASKVKCHKEKPMYSRCAKHGLACEYIATKHRGRKHDNRWGISHSSNTSPPTTAAVNVNKLLPPLGSWFGPNSTTSSADPLPSPRVIHNSPRPTTSGAASNLFSSLLSPISQSLSSAVTDLSADLDDYFALTTDLDDFFVPPLSFPVPGISDTDILGQAQFFSIGADNTSNGTPTLVDTSPILEDAFFDHPTLSSPRSSLNNRVSPTSDAQNYQGSSATDWLCPCLVQALGLMKQLFPNPSNAYITSATQCVDKSTTLPTIQAVIAKNEATIEAVGKMLK